MSKLNTTYDIAEAFEAIENELMASMIRNMRRHKLEEIDEDKQWAMWQAMQLRSLEKYKKDNQKKYGKQFKDINAQIKTLISISRSEGEMDQEVAILEAIRKGLVQKRISKGMTAEFFKINDRKLDALIKATVNDMQKAENAVLRMANDQYRNVIFNAQVYANTGAGTYEKAVDMATKDMVKAGLNCVQYANGARHTLADYADMAIRTASKRAYLQGEGEKRQEWGIPTVIVNKRGNPCPKCLPFCGKVLIDDVWSGGSKDGISPVTGIKYPLMSSAIAAGLYHPRCRDAHTTYFEGINTPPEKSKYTKEELNDLAKKTAEENRQQYAKRQECKFERMSNLSLDPDNKKKYAEKKEIWKETPATMEEINKSANESLLQIYDDRREYLGLNLLPASELKNNALNPITADYTGISEKVAQKINETIQDLSKEYYSGFTKIRIEDKKKAFGVENFATTVHNNAAAQKTLILNPFKMADYDKMVGRIEELSQKGYCVKIAEGTADRYIATHEFAHSLIDMQQPLKNYIGMDVKQPRKIRKEIKELYEKYKADVSAAEENIRTLKKDPVFQWETKASNEELMEAFKKLDIAKEKLNKIKISAYSMENADEFMAEAFTQAKIGEYQSEYSRKVMKVLDKNFRKPVEKTSASDIMKLPKYEKSVIPRNKFTEYALNPAKDPDKAKAFKLALGYTIENADHLIEQIRSNLPLYKAVEKGDRGYGMTYEVIMDITGPNGKTAKVLTAWIDDQSKGEMRLTTIHVD